MRVQTMVVGLLQAAFLMACDRSPDPADSPGTPIEAVKSSMEARDEADAIALGAGTEPQATASRQDTDVRWDRHVGFDPAARLIVRTGQASIEVDSLESAMAELRRITGRAGGFVADASVQSGRNQLRQAVLELKVPAARFDELTEGLQPIGRLEFVNVGAEDVSEEFVDLTARAANGHRLEERLVELLRTRTGKLQDVLSVERELARVREEIERMEGRLRYLEGSARLSTLSVTLHEPLPIVATHGQGPIVEAFRAAWRNFIGVLAGGIASLGFVAPVLALGWGVVAAGRKWRRSTTPA
jgi:hypothetical protein